MSKRSRSVYNRGPRMGQRRPGWVDPLPSLERPDDDSRRTQADAPTPASAVPLPSRAAVPRTARAPATGLYDPRFEHDACGVALVADLHGRRSPRPGPRAVSALEHLAHRGATGSEEDSGDGAGILLQVPDEFYAGRVDFELPARGHYATGIAFLSARSRPRPPTPAGRSASSPARRGSTCSAGGPYRSTTRRWGRSPTRPCPRCTRSSWPRRRAPRWPGPIRPWPSTGWPSCCASGPSTRSTTATSSRCRRGPSSTRGCSPPTS